MNGLSEDDRALAARLLQGHSLAELAASEGVSTAWMRERLADLLERLRSMPAPAGRHTPPDAAGSRYPQG